MGEIVSKINLQEPQRNRNATANYVNLIRTSTVTALDETATWARMRFKPKKSGSLTIKKGQITRRLKIQFGWFLADDVSGYLQY